LNIEIISTPTVAVEASPLATAMGLANPIIIRPPMQASIMVTAVR
jgi:hypothetical protein